MHMRTFVGLVAVVAFVVACGSTGGGKKGPKAGEHVADAGGGTFTLPDSTTTVVVPDPTNVECGPELEGKSQLCFNGDQSKIDVGDCRAGNRTCHGGFWGPCLGMMAPTPEYCDGHDNNCDGTVDEGVLSSCGNCDPYCGQKGSGAGTSDPLIPTDENSQNVIVTPEGWLTLTATSVNLNVIYVSNSGEHTVSKLDTNTGYEMGRYNFCSDPSRTAVDKHGNGWVGCRGGQKVAKIINYEGECEDKNNNGTIETSRDLDNDHKISPAEMLGAADECIKFVVDVPAASIVRGMAVDYQQHGWAALWEAKQLVRYNDEDGAVEQQINIPVNPYGIAMDKQGVIWVSGRGGNPSPQLVRADPATGQVSQYSPGGTYEPYGICIDEFGRIWTANCCGNHVAWMFDPANGQWKAVGVHGRPRGLVANGNGRIFVANDESNEVAVIDMQSMSAINFINTAPDAFPLGMAVDSAGFVWAVNQNSGSVTKINSFTLEVVGHHPVGKSPYTYSDMTGTAFFDAVPEGWYRHRFEAAKVGGLTGLKAMKNAFWGSLMIDFIAPPGSFIKFRVRTGETVDELEKALWTPNVGPFPEQTFPVDLATVLDKKGHYLEVEVRLYPSDDGEMPLLKGFDVGYQHVP